MSVASGPGHGSARTVRVRTAVLAVVAVLLLATLLVIDVAPWGAGTGDRPAPTSVSDGPPTGTAGATVGG